MNVSSSAANTRIIKASAATSKRTNFLNIFRIIQSAEKQLTSLSPKVRAEKKFITAIKGNNASYIRKKLIRHPELTETLLTGRGVSGKFTPLGAASQSANLNVMSELIQAGADVNRTDSEGATALMFASLSGSTKAVELLLDNHARVNQVDRHGFYPLLLAVRSGSIDVVNLLLTHDNAAQMSQAALYRCALNAAGLGHFEILKTLMDHGADIHNKPEHCQINVLASACQNGHLNIARFLVAQEMDVNEQTPTGSTALHLAIRNRHVDVVKFLLAAGASLVTGTKKSS